MRGYYKVDGCKKSSVVFVADNDSRTDCLIDGNGVDAGYECTVNIQKRAKFNLHWFGQSKKYQNISLTLNYVDKKSQGVIRAVQECYDRSVSNLNIHSNHLASDTTSRIYFKGLGDDASRATISGWVNIYHQASNADVFLSQDALLLSPDSHIETIPNLEILNNDVKASHSATTGQPSPAQIHYLNTRGLTTPQATTLIASGFINSLINKISNSFIKDYCYKLHNAK